MKNAIRKAAAASAAILGALAFAGTANAGGGTTELIREAHRVVDYSEDLSKEVHRHFRHTSEYRHLIADAAKIRNEARHIDKLSHNIRSINDLKHIRADIEDLDELVHHVADLVEDISRGCARGHIDGDTRHVEALIAKMNRSLHAMERRVKEIEYSLRSRSRATSCDSRNVHYDNRSRSRDIRYDNRSSHSYNRAPVRRSSSTRRAPSVGERIAAEVVREIIIRRR